MDEYKHDDFWKIVKSEFFKTIHHPDLDTLVLQIATQYPQSINRKNTEGISAIEYSSLIQPNAMFTEILLSHGAQINHIFYKDMHRYSGLSLLEAAKINHQEKNTDETKQIYELFLAKMEKDNLEKLVVEKEIEKSVKMKI